MDERDEAVTGRDRTDIEPAAPAHKSPPPQQGSSHDVSPKRRWPKRVAAGLVLLGALYSLGWWLAADRLKGLALAWIEARRAAGERIETGDITVSGFPVGIRVSVADPLWIIANGSRQTAVSGESVAVLSRIHEPFRIRIESETPITVAQGPLGGPPNAEATATRWRQAIQLRPFAGPEKLTGTASDVLLSATDPSGAMRDIARVESVAAKVALADPKTVGPQDIGATLSFTAEGASSAAAAFPVTDKSGFAAIELSVRGPVPAIHPRALVAWRDAGGIVDIDRVRIDWTPVRLEADGTVALDEGLQPIGAGTAEIRGLEGVFDSLAERGTLGREVAAVAKIIVAIFTRPSQKDGTPVVRLPLSIQNRTLSAAQFELLELPVIRW